MPKFEIALQFLQENYEIERYIALSQCKIVKFKKKWEPVYPLLFINEIENGS